MSSGGNRHATIPKPPIWGIVGHVIAASLIRQELLKQLGPRRFFSITDTKLSELVATRTHRVQFHPGYGYEDFVRGLQIASNGQTEYRDGVLLRVVEEMQRESVEEQKIPVVLILDEMNRADLSKVLGECFSLLEDRDTEIRLGGHDEKPRKVRLPANLYVIGTMNPGGCAVPRYARYKSRLRRHTHDTLDWQNGAFGDLPDVH